MSRSCRRPMRRSASEEDDTLVLLFMCCHPALTLPSAIALTLRAVGGLTTAEIANAFLVPEATMAQRISRAKQSIKSSRVPFSMPSAERARRATERGAARAVSDLQRGIHEQRRAGSAAHRSVERGDPADARVHALLPDDGEVAGLLALMLLTDARRAARTGAARRADPAGRAGSHAVGPAADRRGCRAGLGGASKGSIGPYQLQAAIAAVHDEARASEDTDWPQILALYGCSNGCPTIPW